MRKPRASVTVQESFKAFTSKQFDEVKSVETKMNGRFNEHTLILSFQ